MSTPHIESLKGDIAKNVIMPGDPLRAKFIAENFLENVRCVNTVRNVLAYTGTYKGKEITVFASGMGMPSMGIYCYELYKEYDVENIIRVGTAGSYSKTLPVLSLLLVDKSYSDSSFAYVKSGYTDNFTSANQELNKKIIETAKNINQPLYIENIYSTDVFYSDQKSPLVEKYQLKSVEMESFSLFHTANQLGKKAACLLTISDNLETGEETSAQERQTKFTSMMILALESCL
ncbi:MAG: purine-nucleoside phosphorylase [Firmicutes bacterium]|nr:purine-nucleoside phosphorylase [Bacillota bacterium]